MGLNFFKKPSISETVDLAEETGESVAELADARPPEKTTMAKFFATLFNVTSPKSSAQAQETEGTQSDQAAQPAPDAAKSAAKKPSYLKLLSYAVILAVVVGVGWYRYLYEPPTSYVPPKNMIPKHMPIPAPLAPMAATAAQPPLTAAQMAPTAQLAPRFPAPNIPAAVNRPLPSPVPVPVVQSRVLYVPARDILGDASAKTQQYETEAQESAAQSKALKSKLEVKKQQVEEEMIPFMKEAQKREYQLKAEQPGNGAMRGGPSTASRTNQHAPVNNASVVADIQPMPTLTSVQKIGDVYEASLAFPTGEQVRARTGQTAGAFKVQNIEHNNVVISDKEGKSYSLYMRMPDKYPVSPSMFAQKSGNATTQSANTVPQQPMSNQQIGFMSPGGNR
jgi:hypothetical protein